jgi:hypothetical protein
VDPWAQEREPRWQFDRADRMIKQPSQSAEAYPGPLLIGAVGMAFMMFMRARFYWWPIHALGLLTCSSWHAHRLWLPFFLGWLTKVCIMKFSGGHHHGGVCGRRLHHSAHHHGGRRARLLMCSWRRGGRL